MHCGHMPFNAIQAIAIQRYFDMLADSLFQTEQPNTASRPLSVKT